MKRPAASAFFIIGIVFLIIGISNNSTFLTIGAVFVVLGVVAARRNRRSGGA